MIITRPCPWCTNLPTSVMSHAAMPNGVKMRVVCINCGAEGPCVRWLPGTTESAAFEECISKWNKEPEQ